MRKMTWEKAGRFVSSAGTTNIYRLRGTDITVESRKRAIPHANGIGTWDYTSYFVLDDGVEIYEKNSLADAKKLAEIVADTQYEMGVV